MMTAKKIEMVYTLVRINIQWLLLMAIYLNVHTNPNPSLLMYPRAPTQLNILCLSQNKGAGGPYSTNYIYYNFNTIIAST